MRCKINNIVIGFRMLLLNKLVRLFNKFKPRSRVLTDSPIQVTFTGGLGAQIISTAIYWLLLEKVSMSLLIFLISIKELILIKGMLIVDLVFSHGNLMLSGSKIRF